MPQFTHYSPWACENHIWLGKLDQIKQHWSGFSYAFTVEPQACSQSFVSCKSSLLFPLEGLVRLFDVIQLTRHGRLPVALHYDPIQSARLPASTASIASAHRTGKEPQRLLIIAASLFLQSAEKIISFKLVRGRKKKKEKEKCGSVCPKTEKGEEKIMNLKKVNVVLTIWSTLPVSTMKCYWILPRVDT